jgi:hypothetical protein
MDWVNWLTYLANLKESGFASRYRPFYQHDVLFRSDIDHLKVLDGLSVNTHVTRHFLALDDPCRPSRATDGTGCTMVSATMGLGTLAEPITFDGSCKAPAL